MKNLKLGLISTKTDWGNRGAKKHPYQCLKLVKKYFSKNIENTFTTPMQT